MKELEKVSSGIYYHIITPYAKINEVHPMVIVEEIKNIWKKEYKNLKK